MQRALALEGGGVLEGRDIGTKVVPETKLKFFLTATPDVRAMRRHAELAARGTPPPYEQVLADMTSRDHADSTRADSPLTDDGTYVRVDTSALSAAEVVERLLEEVGRPDRAPG
jgi:cytidylate kinase